jgi:hypothetical protein
MKHATRLRSIRVQCLVSTRFLSVGLYLIPGTLMAQQANVTPLMSKILTDIPGKEGLMITVEYPPGGRKPFDLLLAPPGRHGKRHPGAAVGTIVLYVCHTRPVNAHNNLIERSFSTTTSRRSILTASIIPFKDAAL